MAVSHFFILSFCIGVVFAASIPDPDKVEVPADDDGEQQELAWQSAFWAVVSIALGAATQPSGSILGMPREWGFALKCSPMMCIFNTLEVLLCIIIERQDSGWRLAFRSTKYTDAPNPRRLEATVGQHATRSLETNTPLRLASFILGPLLQAVKLFACSGILCTKLLAGCYLASFLSDELALNFIWLSGDESHHQETPFSLVASVSSLLGYSRSQEDEAVATTSSAATSESPDLLRAPAKLAVDLSITAISWFISSLIFVFLSAKPDWEHWISIICILILAPIYGIFVVVKQVLRDGFTLRVAKELSVKCVVYSTVLDMCNKALAEGQGIVSTESSTRRLYGAGIPYRAWHAQVVGTLFIAVGIGMAGLRYLDAWSASHLKPSPTEPAPRVLYPSIAYAVAADILRDLLDYEIWSSARPAPHRLWGTLFLGVWCLLHFLTALLFYYLIFDPSRTVKPGWTEVLG
ncbi:hypothetical protein PG985_015107 [Apiospora marii]|uniref:uncharacterized protein n=1 Tax=Apiospora marii TaxID=335849 RepID=UPI003130477E